MTNRFQYYWDWTDFSVGFQLGKTNTHWSYTMYFGIDFGFLSMWIYFLKE